MNATQLMKSILASSDTTPRRALLSRLLYPLLAAEVSARTDRLSEQIMLPVSDGETDSAIVLDAVYTVVDWNLAQRVAIANVRGELLALPSGFVDDCGNDHDALVVLLHERPVVIVHAVGEAGLAVRIGGFQRSGVVHDGCLMQLSQDAASDGVAIAKTTDSRDRRRKTPAADRAREGQKRKARALARLSKAAEKTSLAVPLPAIVIRVIGRIGDATRAAVQAVLHRDPPPRLDENGLAKAGPARIGALAARVKAGLGVHVLQTSHALRNLGFTKTGADNKIEQELAGGELGVSLLMETGRASLSDWTGLDNESQLALFATDKYRILENLSFATPMPDRESRVRAELANIKLLSLTYARAKNVLDTFERNRKSSQKLANVEIGAAYARVGANFSTRNLIEIAMTADINPIPLWPSHGEVSAGTFEVLRFIGRLQRGTNAVLLPVHFDIVRQALVKEPTERTLSEMVIAGILDGFYDARAFTEGLNLVEQSGDALVIARSSRDLAIGTAVPRATLDS